jgi:perosamine synthetase
MTLNIKMFKDFITLVREIYQSEDFIPLHEPRFGASEKEFVEDCIDSTFVSSVGKYVDQFETIIAEFTGANHAIAVVNGTQALYMALILAGADANTEVITQSLTFVATANAISYTGAKPVFVDVDEETMGLSPISLKQFLHAEAELRNGECYNKRTGKRIVACVPMHTFGLPCYIKEVKDVCDEFGLILVEDSAESLGSYIGEKHTGTFGSMGILSFNGNKVITTGGGGMILFQDKELALKAKHLTTTAKVPDPWEFMHDEIGYNFRMPNLNAALGVAQMESLPFFLEQKKQLHQRYIDFFQAREIKSYSARNGVTANYWLNAILLENRESRDQFLEITNKQGIMTRGLWTPMHHLPMYVACQRSELNTTEFLFDRVVNIPSSTPSIQ